MTGATRILGALLALSAAFAAAQAETRVRGVVNGDWNADDSPYIAEADLTVPAGERLTIGPGVQILFENNSGLTVSGLLTVLGHPGDSVFFQPAGDPGYWKGLRFWNADTNCTLRFAVITEGRAWSEVDSLAAGGNLQVWLGKVTLEHSRLSGGLARLFGGGAALFGSRCVFTDCAITENRAANPDSVATRGGALLIRAQDRSIFLNCRIAGNYSQHDGGAIYIMEHSRPRFEGCEFRANTAEGVGGAAAVYGGSSPLFAHCRFQENHSGAGGAVYIRDEGSNPLLLWNTFYANATTTGSRVGGAVYIRAQAAPEILYCSFIENDANYGGGIYLKEPPRAAVHHCLFVRNGALRGGGAVGTSNDLGDTPWTLMNCTFFNNRGTGVEPVAVTAYARQGARIHLRNSIVWGPGPHFGEEGLVSAAYSHIIGGLDGPGNSDADPGFLSRDSTFLMLSGDSPCLDSGDPDSPLDPDSTQADRGWLYCPRTVTASILDDTLSAALTTADRVSVPLRFQNRTGVPIYVMPLESWRPAPLDTVNLTAVLGDSAITAVALSSEGFVASGWGGGEGRLYLMDVGANPYDDFPLPDGADYPFPDLAGDGGQLLYGVNHGRLFEFTAYGEPGERFSLPGDLGAPTGLALDTRNAYNFADFYFGDDRGAVVRTDGEVWERARFACPQPVVSLGARWNLRAVYTLAHAGSGAYALYWLDPDSARFVRLFELTPPDGYRWGGFEITQDFLPGRGLMTGVWQGEGGNPDLMVSFDVYTAWLAVKPEGKLLMPDEEVQWNVLFAGDQMPAGQYESDLHIVVNDGRGDNRVHLMMDLTPVQVSERHKASHPVTPRLISVYPNPFNGVAWVKVELPEPGTYELFLADPTGRKILVQTPSAPSPGIHVRRLVLDRLASGTYFVGLRTAQGVQTRRLTLVK